MEEHIRKHMESKMCPYSSYLPVHEQKELKAYKPKITANLLNLQISKKI